MLNRKLRPALEDLRSHLASWSVEVPPRAVGFHRLRSDFERQVSALLGRWVLRPGEAEQASLRRQVESLGDLAPVLAALVRQAEELEKEVVELRSSAERSDDRELASWVAERCVNWQFNLRRLGANVDRLAELDQDQASLERTREQVRRHAEAVRRLEEAAQLLRKLGDKTEALALNAALPLLRLRLFEEGASAAWLAETERAVHPLREIVDLPPKAPPQTLQQIPPLLAEIRRWVRVLGTGAEQVHVFQERYQIAESEWEQWTDDQVQALLGDAAQWLDHLRRAAGEQRAAALSLLRERSLQLAAACGPNLELERDLASLETAEFGEPETYEDWIEREREVHRRLLNVAGSRVGDLKAWIEKSQRDLGARLEALRSQPVSSRTGDGLQRLALALGDLFNRRGEDLELLFEDLATCSRLARELDGLAAQARADRDALSAAQRRLLARHQALRQEVARSGIEVADLAPRIESLADAPPGTSLDSLRMGAAALELELAALEKELAARCTAWVAERMHALDSTAGVLRLAGRTPAEPPALQVAGAVAVVAVRQYEAALERQLDEVWQELRARGEQVEDELKRLALDGLRREERDVAIELGRRLAASLASDGANLEESLRGLWDLLESCDTFLAQLSRDERQARERAQELRRRLRRLDEDGLDAYCPAELFQRASALVHGIPQEPRRWGAALGQVEAAEELLSNLEDHALRHAAAEVEKEVCELERRVRTSPDAAFTGPARNALAQVEAWGHDRIAPALLRMRVRMLAAGPGETKR